MNKKLKTLIIIFAITLAILAPLFVGGSSASASNTIREELENEVRQGLNDLSTAEMEEFFRNLENNLKYSFGTGFRNLVERILNGEQISATLFLELIWGGVRQNVLGIATSLITIIALSILFGLSKGLNSGFLKDSTSQIVYYVIYAAIIAILAVLLNSVIMDVRRVVSLISSLVQIAFPILLTLIAAIGGTASAAVYQPITLIITQVVIRVIEFAVLPLFYGAIVFSIIGNLTNNVKLEKLTKGIQSVAKWTLGIMFGVIISVLTVQGIVGASIDTVSIRSARFALNSYVPILGGYLSEGFDIIMASAILLKNAFGLAAVIILFIVVLGPVMKLIVMSLMMKLTAGIIEPLSESRIPNLLYSTSKNLSILISVVLGLTFLVFMLFILIIFTFNMGVV